MSRSQMCKSGFQEEAANVVHTVHRLHEDFFETSKFFTHFQRFWYQYWMINNPQNIAFLHHINVVKVTNKNTLWWWNFPETSEV
jgi:hypothetical protein